KDALLHQFRKPSGWLGRLNVRDMNRRHSDLTDWGLTHVSIGNADVILDLGCGGGRTVQKLAAIANEGRVCGVDYSEASVTVSHRNNRQSIRRGRVEIQQASVSRLPYGDRLFDLVTAVETHYYWPDLPANLLEVWRVLKPGGALVIIAEAYKGGKFDGRNQLFARAMQPFGYSHLSLPEHDELLSRAGYSDVKVFEEYEKGWMCALGRKPV
ncbi:MAG TPA: methyltransferase domain-containing protein, partial [Thermoanaerobaculia bacterium]